MSRKLASVAAFLLICPLVISATYISCAPMKSLNNEIKSSSFLVESPQNICDASYAPTVAKHSKATHKSQPQVDSPFARDKVIFDTFTFSSKASDPDLLNQQIAILVDSDCARVAPGELTKRILLQNDIDLHDLPKVAFRYTVNESMKLSQLTTLADADSCIIGVTPPGEIRTSSLPLPRTTDVHLTKQDHLKSINYSHAYQYLSQLSTAQAVVAFADTGVDCIHQDLAANLAAGCGYNVINPGTDPTDNDGHGSHTAGIVGAVTNNGLGIAGIAGVNTKIYAIKVIDVNSGNETSLTNGIQRAISENVDVLNISIESQTRLAMVESAVISAVNAGIVVTMAAGNHAQNLGVSIEVSPALVGNVNGAITVGSVDSLTGQLSDFSNYGQNVEIAVTGAVDSSKDGMIGGVYSLSRSALYQRLAGTSQASPIVAGAAALLIQFFKQHSVPYTPADIEQIIMASSDSTGINIKGGRVLNFSKLVRNAYKYADVSLCPTSSP